MEHYNVRAQNEKTGAWFAVMIFDRHEATDLARALHDSPHWCMVTLTRDTEESVEGWRE